MVERGRLEGGRGTRVGASEARKGLKSGSEVASKSRRFLSILSRLGVEIWGFSSAPDKISEVAKVCRLAAPRRVVRFTSASMHSLRLDVLYKAMSLTRGSDIVVH